MCLDIETTGLYKYTERIVEIGMIAFSPSGEILSQFNYLINPEISIPAEATAIHGITDGDVENAPTFGHIINNFFDYLDSHGDSFIIAHNALFDVGFINESIARVSPRTHQPRFTPVHCSLQASRRAHKGLRSHSLADLARYYNLPPQEAHRSPSDCMTLMDVWLKMNIHAEEYEYMKKYNIVRWSQ
jgi:DNA polymerase III epsilon subunit family exonuclease